MPIMSRHVNTPDSYSLDLPGRATLQDKLYVGFVKDANDVLRMGRLKVWIPELAGNPNDEQGWFIVSYCSPFAGATNVYDNKNDNSLEATQKSYGMWFVPPDINNEVVCAFIGGDPARGIWFGCLFQQNMNHMVPGIPGQNNTASTPVAEYNKRVNHVDLTNPTRPAYSPLAEQLAVQGLDQDSIRGVTDSGARRDDPVNSVYGILTPGGQQFVFDDSPVNSFMRLRTASGAQVLINDTVGCIYLNSVDGRNWISMDANGRVDIYAYDDISIRSQGSLNIRADRDVNIEAGQNINMKARGDVVQTPVANPASPEEPPPITPGPTTVIGDDIALGVGQRINNAGVFARIEDDSTTVRDRVEQDSDLKGATNIVVSMGTQDFINGPADPALLVQNCLAVRAFLEADNYVWILPYNETASAAIQAAAAANGDKTLALSQYPTQDGIYPRDYALVANDASALCIPTPGTESNASPSSSTVGSPDVGDNAAEGTSYVDIVTPFLVAKEGFPRGGASYWDPPSQRSLVSVGYGHQIKTNEYAQGYIDTGPSGRVTVSRPNPSSASPNACTMDQPKAQNLLRLDIPAYAATTRRLLGGGAWDALGPYQQAALVSVCYNLPAAIRTLVSRGITDFIARGNIEGAAALIEGVATTVQGVPNAALIQRRKDEANMYRQRPDLIGTGAGQITIGGESIAGTGQSQAAQGGLVLEDPAIQNGYIRVQSRNSMHFLSGQYMFTTSVKDMHRFTGGSLFDTAAQNVNRLAGGYMHESVNGGYTVTSGAGMNLYAPRIDLNGVQPPTAIAAVAAQGPADNKQTDAILNSIGNVTLITTDTILYHLPFHEPYDNHGGRNFESIRDATRLNEETGLRDGEIVPNSAAPLDLYGSPRADMPPATYRGIAYNTANQPIYQYEGPLGNVALAPTASLTISDLGKQFIKARENGSYMVINTGQPPKKSVGYGHELSATEISTNSVTIGGAQVPLSIPLTQPQINELFDQDITEVQEWMRPALGNLAVTQTQFDMLCSLAFNIGKNNFESSPAIKALMDNDLQKVPNNWMKHTLNAEGRLVQGLVSRRRAEVTRYLSGPDIDRVSSRVPDLPPADGSTIGQVTPSPPN